jgi:hypothetical protein
VRAAVIAGVAGGVAACGAAALAGCGAGSDGLIRTFEAADYDTLDEWPGAAAFEEQFELDLPGSSRDVRLASDGFQDPIYQFRLTIDSGDLAAIESSAGCGGLLAQSESSPRASLTTVELDWWRPEGASAFQQCRGVDSSERVQHVFVDESDPSAYDVYIQVLYL